MDPYDEAIAEARSALSATPELRDIVRYATLAANSHNTQPWRFMLSRHKVTILPDFSRRTPVADPDDHHLFASLGCAAENLALAAAARGLHPEIGYDGAAEGQLRIALSPAPAAETTLFAAIPARQCARSEYDGQAVPAADLRALEDAARMEGVRLRLMTDKPGRETVLEYLLAGNTAQVENPAFVDELKHWLRFNRARALQTRDGLFAGSSGNPTLPSWLARLLFRFVFTTSGENDRYARQMRSSAGVAIFIGDRNDKAHWVNAGRSYQRFALQATALGISQAPVNQAVEVAQVRAEFARWLGLGDERPDLVVRFGYGPQLPKSLRRSVDDVIV